jgi:hypothetical protein
MSDTFRLWSRAEVLTYVRERGRYGATAREVESASGNDHGKISGKLSTLHRDGHLALTIAKRAGYGVYKAPEHVLDREGVRQHGHNRPCPHCGRRPHFQDEQEEEREWQR